MPVYLVKSPTGDRLVEAGQKATAVNHVIRDMVLAAPVSASELVKLLASGLKVETAQERVGKPEQAEMPGLTPEEAALGA